MARAKLSDEEKRKRNAERQRRWREKNKDHIRSYESDYRKRKRPEVGQRVREQARKWHAVNKERVNSKRRENRLVQLYGLTVEQRDAMLAAQGFKCSICRTDTPDRTGWHVDHSHATGNVRSILCAACNVGLGHFKDNPSALRSAADYIEKHQ